MTTFTTGTIQPGAISMLIKSVMLIKEKHIHGTETYI